LGRPGVSVHVRHEATAQHETASSAASHLLDRAGSATSLLAGGASSLGAAGSAASSSGASSTATGGGLYGSNCHAAASAASAAGVAASDQVPRYRPISPVTYTKCLLLISTLEAERAILYRPYLSLANEMNEMYSSRT